MKNLTIKDIANLVGVSTTTISHYLNGKYEFMSEETKEKIKTVITANNYIPSNIAKSLRSNKSFQIGVLVYDIGNSFISSFLNTLSNELYLSNYQMLVLNSANSKQREIQNLKYLIEARVDAIIINTVGNNFDYIKEFVKNSKVPVILFDRIYDKMFCDSITNDNYNLVIKMFDELKNKKNKNFDKIIYITEFINNIYTRLVRWQAVKDYANANNIDFISIETNEKNKNHMFETLEKNYNTNQKICIFSLNDSVLFEILEALNHLKININDNITLITFSTDDRIKYYNFPINYINQNTNLMAKNTAKLILKRINDNKFEYKLIEVNGFVNLI